MHVAMSIGPGMKSCTLSGFSPCRFRYKRQVDHRRQVAARMAGDEIGHEILLLSRRGRLAAKLPGEGLELFDRRLLHPPQHFGIGMFGGDLQQPARVMPGQLADVRRAAQGQVHADARGHQHLLHARLPPRRLQQFE